MDDTYLINIAKTEFREAYNRGDVEKLLSLFEADDLTDMSDGSSNGYDKTGMDELRERWAKLFAEYSIKLTMIIIKIVILKDTAYDYGWHEFILTPRNEGGTIHKRQRYFELWKKNSSGDWKISLFIDNADVREQMAGWTSHWFHSEEAEGTAGAIES